MMSGLLGEYWIFLSLSVAPLLATIVVVVGLWLEYQRYELRVFHVAKTTKLTRRSFRTSKLNRPARKNVGSVLVVIGVALEAFFGVMLFLSATVREKSVQTRLIAIAPRAWLLTPDVTKELRRTLTKFTGQKVDVVIKPSGEDPKEPSLFASAIKDVLAESNWDDPFGRPLTHGFIPLVDDNGFFIGINLLSTAQTQKAASALEGVLAKEMPEVLVSQTRLDLLDPIRWERPARDDDGTITVEVGIKLVEPGFS